MIFGSVALAVAQNDNANPNAGGNSQGKKSDTPAGASQPSGNDNSDKTNGKPCDGCVGNADDKNPKGQSPGDKNKGHECDDKRG